MKRIEQRLDATARGACGVAGARGARGVAGARGVEAMVLELLKVGQRKRGGGPACPEKIKPLLKALADHAAKGRMLTFHALKEAVEKETGIVAGRCLLRRWILESGGTPWFQAK